MPDSGFLIAADRVSFAVVLNGAAVPGGPHQTFTLRSSPVATANIVTNFDNVVNVIGRPLTAIEDDWLDLLAAIHASDMLCLRGRNEAYVREIHVSLKLREPSHFRPYLPVIEGVFGRLGQDRLVLYVEPWDSAPVARYPTRVATRNQGFDKIALLSGGLDSAAAAAELLNAGANPCFVSSVSAPHIRAAQLQVIRGLEARFSAKPVSAGFEVSLKAKHPTLPLPTVYEPSQRGRTLLFTGVAALIAAATATKQVIVGENGVLAINCPLTGGRYGPFSTHTAHPRVLASMSQLYASILGCDVSIDNPLLFDSKTEVVVRLKKLGLGPLVPRTHSCWIARRSSHCGVCVPCLVRRFATKVARVPDVTYETDLYTLPWDPKEPRSDNLGDYITFARNVASLSDLDLTLQYAELSVPGGAIVRRRILEMHRRWASDVLKVVASQPAIAHLAA